jgi:aryl-alcohol dehydrogenase (NADP+)
MTFGLQTDRKASFEILDTAFEAGLGFVDTADVYPIGGSFETVGRTEEIVGEWMRERSNRARILLASKCCFPMGPGPNRRGLSRQHILDAVDASLQRLGTDCIDLFQAHEFDPHTPIEETLRAFEDVVRAGKVRYLGCSNYPAWRLAGALAAAERLDVAGYVSAQPRYNLLYREIETELLPLCRAEGLGVLAFNPLAGGLLPARGPASPWAAPPSATRAATGRRPRSRRWSGCARWWSGAVSTWSRWPSPG